MDEQTASYISDDVKLIIPRKLPRDSPSATLASLLASPCPRISLLATVMFLRRAVTPLMSLLPNPGTFFIVL